MTRVPFVVCLIAALFIGCATRGDVHQVTAELKDVRTELGGLRQSQDTLSRQLTEMATSTVAARATTEQLQESITTTNTDVARVATRLDSNEAAVKRLGESVTALATPPPPSLPPSAPGTPSDNRAGTAERAFAAGLASFRAREYGQAILDFLDVVGKYREHVLAPSAQYWIGESYYAQHDYRQALIEFRKVIDWTSPNPKVPDALVKSGLCYDKLREGSRAQDSWRRVVREFPDSPAAAEARGLLAAARRSSRR